MSTWTWGLGSVTWGLLDSVVSYGHWGKQTSGGTDLDVQSVDTEFLAADGNILSCQHGGVWGRLITIGLDLHASGDTGDGFTATGITQNVSLRTILL